MFHSFVGIYAAFQNYLEENRASWKTNLYCDVKEKASYKIQLFHFCKKKSRNM